MYETQTEELPKPEKFSLDRVIERIRASRYATTDRPFLCMLGSDNINLLPRCKGFDCAYYLPGDEGLTYLESIPQPLDIALTNRVVWPAYLIVNKMGTFFFPIMEENADIQRALAGLDENASVDNVIDIISNYSQLHSHDVTHVVHLSDIHLGHKKVNEKALASLYQLLQKLGQQMRGYISNGSVNLVVVITGDLADHPDFAVPSAPQRVDFFEQLHKALGTKSHIIIPGNHDVKELKGNSPDIKQELPDYGVVVKAGVLFVRVDTTHSRVFAMGDGDVSQINALDKAIHEARKHAESDLPVVVLMHHHPIEVLPEEWRNRDKDGNVFLQTLKDWLYKPRAFSQYALELNETFRQHLYRFIAHNGVSLVLHGHEHIPQSIIHPLSPENCEINRGVRMICAGSATGKGTEKAKSRYSLHLAAFNLTTGAIFTQGFHTFDKGSQYNSHNRLFDGIRTESWQVYTNEDANIVDIVPECECGETEDVEALRDSSCREGVSKCQYRHYECQRCGRVTRLKRNL